VSILTTKPQLWGKSLEIVAPDGNFVGQLASVSSDPNEVIPQAEIVLVCLPGFAIHDELAKIKPFLSKATIVGTVVSSTGFFFEAFKLLSSDTPLFGFQRVPFISRTIEYGHKAELKGYKESLSAAIEQAENKEVIHKQLEDIFEKPITLLDSFYEVSLSNSNPMLHPSRTYTMWKDWKPGIVYPDNPQFYAEWTLEASSLLIQMDEEFQNLLKALGLKPGCIPTVLDYYESTDAESLTQKLRSIKAFQGIHSPMKEVSDGYIPDFTSRYFTEDFPYGMRFIIETAQKHNFPIPTIDKVYHWGTSIIS
ncbi:MAG: NAD/NADP octopine/nopaline dehydrogenase family protein, partial [Lachnospiraceae bacterium]|nr:NAD/NADP octopine/nopaline dehydrogenase family protein [Lachnospiraceae bacterium]